MNDGIRQDALIPASLMASLGCVTLVLFAGFSLITRPVTLHVSSRVALAPATFTVEVHVPRHPDNRRLTVCTSEIPLAGMDADPVYRRPCLFDEPGDYLIIGRVWSATVVRGTDRVSVSVR